MRKCCFMAVSFFLSFLPLAWPADVSQRTQGYCNPAIVVGKGDVNVRCSGVDKNQVNELVKIFNEGLRNFKEFQKQLLERQPDLSVRCDVDKQGDPSKVLCSVTNNGRGEARDLIISFARSLPIETIVQAPSEFGVKLEEAGSPPDPQNSPISAKLLTAFVVRVPRVAPKDSFNFTVLTANDDNQRAARQVLKIRNETNDVLEKFGDRFRQVFPSEAEKWNLKAVLGAKIKQENFYSPSKFGYEKGRFPVEFLTEAESFAEAMNQDLYARHKQEFIDIYQNRPCYLAPVVRIRTSNGENTNVIYPPYIRTYANFIGKMPSKGQKLELSPRVPNYEKEQCAS